MPFMNVLLIIGVVVTWLLVSEYVIEQIKVAINVSLVNADKCAFTRSD